MGGGPCERTIECCRVAEAGAIDDYDPRLNTVQRRPAERGIEVQQSVVPCSGDGNQPMKVYSRSVGAHPLCPECFGQVLRTDPDSAQPIGHVRISSDNNNRAVE